MELSIFYWYCSSDFQILPLFLLPFPIYNFSNPAHLIFPVWGFCFLNAVYQVNGCLSYFDKVPDGFYLIHGMDPYVWNVCCDLQESGRIPSIESLKSVDPNIVPSVEVIIIDRHSDPSLKELQNRVHSITCSCITTEDVVDQLAKLVCNHMGWVSDVPL